MPKTVSSSIHPAAVSQVAIPSPTGTIGHRIRRARKALDLNQEQLAARLGVTQPTVANWEADVHNPRQLMLAKLAEVLDVSLGWLAGGEDGHLVPTPLSDAGYLNRGLFHVPVVPSTWLARRRHLTTDELNSAAVDFIPISARAGQHFGVFLDAQAYRETFPGQTLYVFDALRRTPVPGTFILRADPGGPCLTLVDQSHAETLQEDDVFGTLSITVRFF